MNINSNAAVTLSAGSVSLRDELLSLEPTLPLDLFLLVSSSEIVAAFFFPKKNKFLLLDSVSFADDKKQEPTVATLKSFLEERNLLKQFNIVNTRVVLVSDQFTLLPASFYKESDADAVFDFNFTRDDSVEIFSYRVPSFDVQVIYGAAKETVKLCRDLFAKPEFIPHVSGLLESFNLQYKKISSPVLLLNIRQSAVDIVVKENRKLLLANSFKYKTPEDILYYTLNVYEQLQLNPESEKLIVAGRFETGSLTHKLLQKYIRYTEPAERPSMIEYSYVFNELPPHQHFQLFSQVLCVS